MSQDNSPRSFIARVAPLAALIAGHAVSDGCINLIPALWPVFQDRLGLTAAQIGNLAGLVSVTTNFGQPLFGYLADRFRVRHMEAIGPMLVGLFVGLMGQTELVWLFGLFYVLGGIGTAMFHPEGATLAGKVSGSRRGLGMSLFSGGGALGYAAGAPVAVFLYQRFDTPGLMAAAVIGIVAGLGLRAVNVGRRYRDDDFEPLRLRRDVLPHLHKVTALFSLVTLRAVVIVGFNTFIALLAKQWGYDLSVGAYLLFLMVFFGGIGNIAGGVLSDHLGRRTVTVVSLLLSAPFFFGFVHFGLPWGYLLIALAGFLGQMSVSVNIVQGQELIPAGPGVASSLTMGAAWGVAGLSMPIVGWLVDHQGPGPTLAMLGWLMVGAAVLAAFVPDKPAEESVSTDA